MLNNAEKMPKETLTLAIINQKGGVGKSTTTINLSAYLGELEKRTLVVDMDPQGNSTSGYGIDKTECEFCIFDALLNDVPAEEIIVDTCQENVSIMPATIKLSNAEVALVSEVARESRLSDVLDSVKEDYDYILIDCPPSLGLLTLNALAACDKMLIPVQCEFYAMEGVSKLLGTMNQVKRHLNPELDIFGILMTMYDKRTSLSNQVVDEVKQYFGDVVFKTKIPRTVKLSEAPSYGVPVNLYDRRNKGAVAYEKLAEEVIDRANN